MRRAFCYRCGPDRQNLYRYGDGRGWCLVHGSVLTRPRKALTPEEYEFEEAREHRAKQAISMLTTTGKRENRRVA